METLAQRIVAALFNGAYQGLVLTALVGVCLALLRRTNAATRHAVGIATLAVLVALPVVHFLFPPQARGPGATNPTPTPRANQPSVPPAANPEPAVRVTVSSMTL